ncbi:MAG: hypothetical protein SF070_10790 [Gemmatimonadota bacterium]|nr:hypothetical protein [Gemmatimonadota bacterium]
MITHLTDDDLTLLTAALGELQQQGGASGPEVAQLLARLVRYRSALTLSRTGAGQEEWFDDFSAPPPAAELVSDLAAAAIGPENATLRAALRHYGVLRALGPGWIAALEELPEARRAIPAAVWQQMRMFLDERKG